MHVFVHDNVIIFLLLQDSFTLFRVHESFAFADKSANVQNMVYPHVDQGGLLSNFYSIRSIWLCNRLLQFFITAYNGPYTSS